jgi:membrane associated rhomboid family serine protease
MIPLRDNIPSRTTPFVNYAIVGLTALVFFAQLGDKEGALVEQYGMIPARVLHPEQPVQIPDRKLVDTGRGWQVQEEMRPAREAAVPAWLTALTCIFLHGGWLHFLGNMWFLYIFGDNVEDRFGHLGFLVFYLAAGAAASLAHLASAPSSPIPTVGASGAIAGVMGAYLLLYPKAHVLTLVPIFFFLQVVVLPAPLFLGIWFVIQFVQGAFTIAGTQATGVAWWAHIGGFVAGMAVAWILDKTHHLRPRVTTVLPNTDHVTAYRLRK